VRTPLAASKSGPVLRNHADIPFSAASGAAPLRSDVIRVLSRGVDWPRAAAHTRAANGVLLGRPRMHSRNRRSRQRAQDARDGWSLHTCAERSRLVAGKERASSDNSSIARAARAALGPPASLDRHREAPSRPARCRAFGSSPDAKDFENEVGAAINLVRQSEALGGHSQRSEGIDGRVGTPSAIGGVGNARRQRITGLPGDAHSVGEVLHAEGDHGTITAAVQRAPPVAGHHEGAVSAGESSM